MARRSLLGNLSVAVWSFLLFSSFTLLLNQMGSSFSFNNRFLTLIANLAAGLGHFCLFASMIGSVWPRFFGASSIAFQPASVRAICSLPFLENAEQVRQGTFFCHLVENMSVCSLSKSWLLLYSGVNLARDVPLLLAIVAVCSICFIYWITTCAMVNYLLLDFPDLDARRSSYPCPEE